MQTGCIPGVRSVLFSEQYYYRKTSLLELLELNEKQVIQFMCRLSIELLIIWGLLILKYSAY